MRTRKVIAPHSGSNLDDTTYLLSIDDERVVITETAPLRTPPMSTSISERARRECIPDMGTSIHMKTGVS